jgi:general secretion pathway protein D
VPVIPNAVTPVSTGTPVVTGSVQYLDVGLKLEVEPDIHADHEVAIKVNLEVSSIIKEVTNTVSGTLAYQVGTRNASTVLQLKDGETQFLAGLISDEERSSASKVPGLGQIPGVGRLFSSHKDDGKKTEIVLSITPRIVSPVKQPDAREVEYWSGTEATLRNNPVTLKPIGSVSVTSTGGVAPRPTPGAYRPPVTPPVKAPEAAEKTSAAAAGPMQLAWQGPNQAKVGDRISLTLNTDSAPDMNSLGFLVNYDPSVLKAVDATEGNILKQGGVPSTFNKSIDQPGGQVLVDLSGKGPKEPDKPGSVVTVTFEVIAPSPQSKIAVSRISSAGSGGKDLSFTAPEPHVVALVK